MELKSLSKKIYRIFHQHFIATTNCSELLSQQQQQRNSIILSIFFLFLLLRLGFDSENETRFSTSETPKTFI